MTPRKGEILELRIDRVAYGGQGIARVDGLVIFVKGAIPGDRVNAEVFRKKKAYAEARIQELLVPSPDRTQAPCPYFGTCGGCQWQHVRYERQLEYKRGHVEEALSHIGSLSGIEVHDAIPSEKRFAYRNKMEFSFSDRLWLPHPPPPHGLSFSPEKQGLGDRPFQIPSAILSDKPRNLSPLMGEGKGGGEKDGEYSSASFSPLPFIPSHQGRGDKLGENTAFPL